MRTKLIAGQRIHSQKCSEYLVLDRFPENPGHLIACTPNSATNVSAMSVKAD
jgi:hypothetical protein